MVGRGTRRRIEAGLFFHSIYKIPQKLKLKMNSLWIVLFGFLVFGRVECEKTVSKMASDYLQTIGKTIDDARLLLGGGAIAYNPETDMTTTQIIEHRGYAFEKHSVITGDGYVLELHRIPRARGELAGGYSTVSRRKRAVYLQHGILDSSASWVLNPTNRSLAFMLADLGYDVWMGNLRGNTYSTRHTILSPKNSAFWKFSFDQMGEYDIPASIRYILNTTGSETIDYVGHSMGCSVFFIAMIKHPQLNSKIGAMIAMAPASSLAASTSPLRFVPNFFDIIQFTSDMFEAGAFLPRHNSMVRNLQKQVCEGFHLRASFCRNALLQIVGSGTDNLDLEFIPVMNGHCPAGTSVRTAGQFAQNYKSGETFTPYDYGSSGNLVRYGSRKPPPYDLRRVTAPVHIFWGPNDYLISGKDVAWLAGKLGNLKSNNRVDYDSFNHVDFMFAKNCKQVLYDKLIPLLSPP